MKKWSLAVLMVLLLAACEKARNTPKNYVGVWVGEQTTVQAASSSNAGFQINNRILIEQKGEGLFAVSILARGVFTDMKYIPGKGYICAENNACFDLKDKNTLLVGGADGVTKEYKRGE